MRLSHIKLAGFKSFVDPTKIPFPDQMTCVVGPNGCGKSNVIDAVRWVLGESSAKNLRGDAMTDVIFNGSTHRKAISQASVELMFDNTQGTLPGSLADRNQIAIKRLVTRDGQSLYYLNGSKCRRRDITDIFLGTGLGPRSYAIIEQGMISRLIESKPHELRVFLEEAAGVSKYKERRKETQTRIKSTRDNLERLLDMRQELQSQLDRLAKQAESARKYKDLKAQERTLKGQLAVLKWRDFNDKLQQKVAEIGKLDEKLNFLEQAHGGQNDVIASFEQQVVHLTDALTVAQQSLHKTHTELTRAEQQKIHLGEKRQELIESQSKLGQELESAQQLLNEQQHASETHQQQCDSAAQAVAICEAELDEVTALYEEAHEKTEHIEHQLELAQLKLSEAHTALSHESSKLQQLEQAYSHQQEKRKGLTDKQSALMAHSSAETLSQEQSKQQAMVKEMALLQSHSQKLVEKVAASERQVKAYDNELLTQKQQLLEQTTERDMLSGLLGSTEPEKNQRFLSQLKVNSTHTQVVERALLSITELHLTEQSEQGGVWPSELTPHPESVANLIDSGVYPSFLNHVKWLGQSRQFVPCAQFFLAIDDLGELYGENFITEPSNNENCELAKYARLEALSNAIPELEQLASQTEGRLTELKEIHAELVTQVEINRQDIHRIAQDIAGNKSRIEVLQQQHVQWTQQSEQLVSELKDVENTLVRYEEEREVLVVQHEQQAEQTETLQKQAAVCKDAVEKHKREYSHIQLRKNQLQERVHQAKLTLQQAQSTQQLSATKSAHLQHSLAQCETSLNANKAQLTQLEAPTKEIKTQIQTLIGEHQAQKSQLEGLELEVKDAKQQLSEKQLSVQDSQAQSLKLKEQKQQLQLQEQSLVVKAQSALEPLLELKQTLKGVQATLDKDMTQGVYQSKLTATGQKLSLLGAVNLAAIEEFDEASARKQYLDEQLNDLTAALETLENAIRKIDRETKTRFRATFDEVNSSLSELFPKVFGGGSAYLELTSDDLLESGVTIMARPPGKKNSTIHLLSGGEKALTALSLVFSIFRLNPAPFCMLDEVDAPLDDANVGRFCRLVEEMSQAVQFIYISHNKVAMEMAARLTGVTMAEPGVSRVVAVDIEQAVQMAHT
ncbi:chromosome segregation protein SMC [Pseudoalteromonas luteoviolacea]|uniref:Chromosome partition protein Smc n=1 Tax=Pseudoalteromonas luteoviolacea TaxID=43657 RepID=A0A1C0TJB0_9GAMM|nr:AAA family ATPase [Pseudoalteromonas luteoviolacea]OCQ18193.1 chromosome segregation protein SMC [Pseudoalteromonas luteoviolacea]